MAGIYVHVPFCHCKCAYCDFYSLARPDFMAGYADAVRREYEIRYHELGGEAVETVYLGGGTPSMLPSDIAAGFADMLITPDTTEATIEVNPEDVTPQKALAWRRAGFNRVSMGVQTLDNDILRYIRRRHSAEQALLAMETLRHAGFDNISADLIYGLPGQSPQNFSDSLNILFDKGIEHLSAYILSYEEGTLMHRRLERGECVEADDETVARMYSGLCRMAARAGFEHYEISNFALPGHRSRHNSAYWNHTPYLGLGPGAHSLDARGHRRYQTPDIRAYMASPAQNLTEEPETATEAANDTIMVSLRRAEGLRLSDLPAAAASHVLRHAAPHIADGHLSERDGYIFIPEVQWLMADYIIRDLML